MLSPLDPDFGSHHFCLVQRKGNHIKMRWLDLLEAQAFAPGEEPSCDLFIQKMKDTLALDTGLEGRVQFYHLHPELIGEYGEENV